jgi:hypothetical protein
MALKARLRVSLEVNETASHDIGPLQLDALIDKALSFANGTGAGQADIVFADERTLAASTSEDLDLAGALANAFGQTITAVELVLVLVVAADANVNDVVLGAATQPIPLFGGTNGTFAVKPGGMFLSVAPGAAGQLTIGAGATDDLKVANSGAGSAVTYKIVILARSA